MNSFTFISTKVVSLSPRNLSIGVAFPILYSLPKTRVYFAAKFLTFFVSSYFEGNFSFIKYYNMGFI